GRNYAKHAEEMGAEVPKFPLLFLKPGSSVVHTGGEIVHPDYSEEMHHEIELILLIGKVVKNTSLSLAEDAIVGYGLGLDMTLRDVQKEAKEKGHPWTTAKCFDTSAVVSEFVGKSDYPLDYEHWIELSVNGEVRQSAPLSSMIFKPAELVQKISTRMSLYPGDLVFTGTPEGVGKVERGDRLEGRLGEALTLSATVV
ncbi:MAG: FAA hydrolase family protein, partial [Ignavibacteriales bacterium]|nr:FAA hydrolase family protein [Ignavibacteriales bacterium]